DTSVVTSGLYERQFEKDGERYWHILDPKTGYPVRTDLVSATIISAASIDGDGYTKPLFMMGHDEALAWINNKDGIEGLVVDANGVITQSDSCGAELVA
ncbi:MAG: FAD:protein FMN transferase, partial [Atopobiaceae bacterium]|nr:FAD:protein FMN transferase [Atopobiaceae bacterium]